MEEAAVPGGVQSHPNDMCCAWDRGPGELETGAIPGFCPRGRLEETQMDRPVRSGGRWEGASEPEEQGDRGRVQVMAAAGMSAEKESQNKWAGGLA